MANPEYWEKALEGFEYAAFPDLTGLSSKGKSSRSLAGSSKTERKLEVKLDAIVQQAKQLEVSLSALLQAAWAKVLAAYVGEHDLCFGYLDGQSQHASVLPLRVAIQPSTTHEKLAKDCFRSWEDVKTQKAPDSETLKATLESEDAKLYDTLLVLDPNASDSTKSEDIVSLA